MKLSRLHLILLTSSVVAGAHAADGNCKDRLEALREMQANTPLLDAQRPDLRRVSQVAMEMADKGRESLCLEIVDELEGVVKEQRENAADINQLSNYAAAVPISSHRQPMSSSSLNQRPVRNRAGEQLGEVRGVEFDPATAKITGLNVVYGGLLGLGEEVRRVDWNQVHLSVDGSSIVLDMTENDLANLPAQN